MESPDQSNEEGLAMTIHTQRPRFHFHVCCYYLCVTCGELLWYSRPSVYRKYTLQCTSFFHFYYLIGEHQMFTQASVNS